MTAPTAPTIPVLGASTVNRKWILEVNSTIVPATPAWTVVGGVTNFQPVTDAAHLEDDSDFSGGGFGSQTKTSADWSATCTVARKVDPTDPTAYDAGQEFLRSKAEGTFGPANSVSVRFYEYDPSDADGTASPRVQAYSGLAAVGWAEQGGAYNALSTVQITLTGQGKLSVITHPFPAS